MAIIIRYRQLKGGYVSPYFEFNHNGKRGYETLPHLKYKPDSKNLLDRQIAVKNKAIINQKLKEKELALITEEYSIKPKYNNRIDFFEYLDEYIKSYPNTGDARAYTSMQKQLKSFVGKTNLFAYEIDEAFIRRFARHLENSLNYETPLTYFKKLKKILAFATKEGVFRSNPAAEVQVKKYYNQEKEILTADEVCRLKNTVCCNNQVKSAFLFAFYTGLRFVDIKKLTWKNISGANVTVIQSKTSVPLIVPIHQSALQFLGERSTAESCVFTLPSHTGCLKAIRKWVKNAEIEKHITFHCARHSLGSNLGANKVDVLIIARLLGHTSLKHTMRYVRTSESTKQTAINTLPNI